MSGEAVLSKIDITQSNCFYFWHLDALPIARMQIEANSPTMQMIAADSLIIKALKSIHLGQVVKLSGYLV